MLVQNERPRLYPRWLAWLGRAVYLAWIGTVATGWSRRGARVPAYTAVRLSAAGEAAIRRA